MAKKEIKSETITVSLTPHGSIEPPRIKARVIELHQPCELIGNAKTITTLKSEMVRLEDGSGDWLIKSKKTGRKFILGSGNMKLAELLD